MNLPYCTDETHLWIENGITGGVSIGVKCLCGKTRYKAKVKELPPLGIHVSDKVVAKENIGGGN